LAWFISNVGGGRNESSAAGFIDIISFSGHVVATAVPFSLPPGQATRIIIMKSAAVGTGSGCIIWIVAFGLVSLCLCPLAAMVGSVSATFGADSVAGIVEPYLCPDNSTAEIITFETTSSDEFGNQSPATSYEMQCIDATGSIVRQGSSDYAFYWVGVLALGSLILSGGAAFLVAAPLGAFIARRRAARTN
jgi:hypothetical protein